MSYDANQRDAYRVRCLRCQKWWDVTRYARFICRDCQRVATGAAREAEWLQLVAERDKMRS